MTTIKKGQPRHGGVIKTDNAKIMGLDIVEQYPADDESYGLVGEILAKQGERTAALRYYQLAQSKSAPGNISRRSQILSQGENR